jgi:Tol biopolymer transport system component
MPGVTLRLMADGRTTQESTTKADGAFAFARLDDGDWSLGVAAPPGYALASGEDSSRTVTITSGGGVTLAPIALTMTSPIAFVSTRDGTPHLYVMRADGSGIRRVTTGIEVEWAPAWSPDGRRIAFNRGPAGDTYVVNADGSGLMRLSSSGGWPSWSPDGRHIVMVAWKPGGSANRALWPDRSLRIVSVDGSSVTEIPLPARVGVDTLYSAIRPRWSPFGGKILVEVDRMWNGDSTTSIQSLLLMNADGTDARLLMDGCSAAWSPDGNRLTLWKFLTISVTDVDIVNPMPMVSDGVSCDGGSSEMFEAGVWPSNATDWSPDARSLVVTRWTAGDGLRLWLVDVQSGVARQLSTDSGQDLDAAWSRDAVNFSR